MTRVRELGLTVAYWAGYAAPWAWAAATVAVGITALVSGNRLALLATTLSVGFVSFREWTIRGRT